MWRREEERNSPSSVWCLQGGGCHSGINAWHQVDCKWCNLCKNTYLFFFKMILEPRRSTSFHLSIPNEGYLQSADAIYRASYAQWLAAEVALISPEAFEEFMICTTPQVLELKFSSSKCSSASNSSSKYSSCLSSTLKCRPTFSLPSSNQWLQYHNCSYLLLLGLHVHLVV